MSEASHSPELYFTPSSDYWELRCRDRYGELLVALTEVLPPGLTLYLEGATIAPDVAAYLEARPAEPVPVHRGTIWPKPAVYQMPMTVENVAGLARLMDDHAEPEIAEHIHAHKDGAALLIWYDAFSSTPLYVRNDVPEDDVKTLCADFDCQYRPYR